MHHEVGFLKVKPETSSLAFIIAQNTGRHVILSSFIIKFGYNAYCHWLKKRAL